MPTSWVTRTNAVNHEISQLIPKHYIIDSLQAVQTIEEYRQYWKPQDIRVILLVESHVYTDENDIKTRLDPDLLNILPGYPHRFVRFVYCLGYGEDELLMHQHAIRRNSGTPQYWKILSTCIADTENNLGFKNILKTYTPSFHNRLRNKIHVLQSLKSKGIWLLDASLVGLYGGGQKKSVIISHVLKICWDMYLRQIITHARPKLIIVIGKGVEHHLHRRIEQLNIPVAVIPQPQARFSRDEQQQNFQKYQRLCHAVHTKHKFPLRTSVKLPLKTTRDLQIKALHKRSRKSTAIPLSPPLLQQMLKHGYKHARRRIWIKDDKVVHLVRSSEYNATIRIRWRDEWLTDFAVIYDYSGGNGPICIIPTHVLFASKFIQTKRKSQSYANSNYQWSQSFPKDHMLVKLILSYTSRWDLLR